ncbi:hypothetical protein ABPG72_018575 [Tetrahymena utriculariae]
MDLQNISEQFLEFLEEQEIDVPEDFIQIFYSSILLDQWISSELAQKYLEYSRKDNFNKALNKFVIKQDYLEISKEEYQQKYKQIDDQNNSIRSDTISKQKQQSNLRKYYLLSSDCFKSMLLMRDSEKGRKYQKKNKQLEKKTLQAERRQKKLILSLQQNQQLEQQYIEELQERDQQQLQLEAEIQELNVQNQYRCNVYKIFKENPLQPQVICFSSNIEKSLHRYQKLLNDFYKEQFDYNYEILGQNLTRQEAIELKQETILELTGQQKIQHYNIQRIIPLFE